MTHSRTHPRSLLSHCYCTVTHTVATNSSECPGDPRRRAGAGARRRKRWRSTGSRCCPWARRARARAAWSRGVCVCVYVWSTTVLVLSCALQCYILANCDCRGLSDRIATLPLGIARSASSRSISPPSAWTTASNPCRYLAGRFESTSGISLVTRRFLRSAMSFTRTRRGFFSCSMSPLETPSMFWVTGWQKRRSSVLIWKTFQSLCAQIRWFSASTCGNVLNSNCVRFFLWYILAQVDKRRDVSEEEGREFASSRGFIYFETSACTGANVTEVFEHLFQKIVANT